PKARPLCGNRLERGASRRSVLSHESRGSGRRRRTGARGLASARRPRWDRHAPFHRYRGIDGAIALFADDPDVFLLGSGVDEARAGHGAIREQIERDLTQSDALSWILSPQSISAAGSVAWTSGDVVVRVTMGGQTLDIPHRLTTVLERRGGEWLVQQMHLSFANGAQVVGQSYPTNLEAVADAVGRERV